jgi:hypothetical protein
MPAHTPDYVEAKKAAGHGMRNLNDEAANWPTPMASDDGQKATKASHQSMLCNVAETFAISSPSLPDRQTPSGIKSAETRRSLNPLFVEWLMGWPEGLSGFAPSATGFAPWLRLMRGELSRLCSPVTRDQGRLL